MQVHSALGKRHGLTDSEISTLATLSETEFIHKEWTALKYAYEWAAAGGKEPKGDFMNEYKSLYTIEERNRINKLMRLMQFSNYFSNMMTKKPWRS